MWRSGVLCSLIWSPRDTPRHVLQCPYGLYAEQLSGTAFTVPRARNQRVWLYRVRPSVVHEKLIEIAPKGPFRGDFADAVVDPNQMRWRPLPLPSSDRRDFVDGEGASGSDPPTNRNPARMPPPCSGLSTMLGAGDPMTKSGMAIHMYACNASSEWDAGDRLCGRDAHALSHAQWSTRRCRMPTETS